MSVSEKIEAIDLAIANEAFVLGLIGASYPNGPGSDGICRDIGLDLTKEQSKELLLALRGILYKDGQ